MKSFRFHLQKVLDLKEKETEQAQWAFGKSVQRKVEEENRLYELAEHREKITESMVQVQAQPISAAQLLELNRYRLAVDRQIHSQKITLVGCEQEVERCQTKLHSHMQESQLWQKLKDKAQETFEENQKSREQKELDEIGITRYWRKENRG
ncbi:flagellar export protein FliJ [Brevibacillus dissolubilis]|uniref:flagellar export protein FliJ n=1 Tax=Brevibacillus dissolubilis TaxID=1844116 RepID=UPI00111698F0|nr:flagellar export protein FliJ [Brevibacillus dissolubilis]